MTRIIRTAGFLLGVAWIMGTAVVFLLTAPGRSVDSAILLEGLLASGAVLAWVLGCVGAGGFLLSRWRPALLDDSLGSVRAGVTGLAMAGPLSMAWGLLGLPVWGILALPILLSAGWLARPRIEGRWPGWPTFVVGLVVLLPGLLVLLAPATDTDELYYHLALPRLFLDEGSLLGGIWYPNGSRPLALHLPYAALLGAGGIGAPRLFHVVVAGTLLWSIHVRASESWGRAAGLLAPLLLAGSTVFLRELGLAYDDLPASLAVFVAFDAAWVTGGLPLVALAAGSALAIKYTAVCGIAPIFLVLGLDALRSPHRWRRLAQVAGTGVGALFIVAPWWIRNVVDGLHPLFPFAGWPGVEGVFQYTQKYGLGREPLDFLLLPWNIVMQAETDSFAFLGRLHPLLLGLLPVGILGAFRSPLARRTGGVAALGFVLWSLGPQWLRYLLPVLPIAVLWLVSGLHPSSRIAHGLVSIAFVLGLPANLAPILASVADRAPASLGWEDRTAFQARSVPGWKAMEWMDDHSPPEARAALLFCWSAAALNRRWILGSVEDHVPSRYLLAREGDRTVEALRSVQAEYVIMDRVHFARRSYPFLDDETWRREFLDPVDKAERLLRAESDLVFEDGSWSVWHIRPGTETGPVQRGRIEGEGSPP